MRYLTQGQKAIASGTKWENNSEHSFIRNNLVEVSSNLENSHKYACYYKKYRYTSVLGKHSKHEFFIPPLDAIVECKNQDVPGSKDEAICYPMENIRRRRYTCSRFILVWTGNAITKECYEYIKTCKEEFSSFMDLVLIQSIDELDEYLEKNLMTLSFDTMPKLIKKSKHKSDKPIKKSKHILRNVNDPTIIISMEKFSEEYRKKTNKEKEWRGSKLGSRHILNNIEYIKETL